MSTMPSYSSDHHLQLALSAVLICFSTSTPALESQWQLGVAAAAIDFRLYPGSRDNKTYVLPLPYFTYHSDFLEVDRGIRGILPSNSNWYLDISADFGVPVQSDDSTARTGMPNLDAMIQIGPSLEYTLSGHRNSVRELRFELPVRSAIAVDIDHQRNEGWLIEPRLVYEQHRSGRSGLYAKVKAGLRYATQDYHAYYYDVSADYVTSDRPLFTSTSGYSGMVIDLSAAWHKEDVLYWGILRYQSLSHSAIEDSPLVEDKNYYFIGLGITWIIAANQ